MENIIVAETDEDCEICELQKTDYEQSKCLDKVENYWTYHEELAVYDGIVLKGDRDVIPLSLCLARSTQDIYVQYAY